MRTLVQYRECDGSCCRAAPRFPPAGNPHECRYRDRTGCLLMALPERQAELVGLQVPGPEKGESALGWFVRTCLGFPQNLTPADDPGDCCYRWEGVNGN